MSVIIDFLLLGGAIGFITSVVCAGLDYALYFYNPHFRTKGVVIFIIGGAVSLGLAGVVALTLSFIFMGNVIPALVMGVGAIVQRHLRGSLVDCQV